MQEQQPERRTMQIMISHLRLSAQPELVLSSWKEGATRVAELDYRYILLILLIIRSIKGHTSLDCVRLRELLNGQIGFQSLAR